MSSSSKTWKSAGHRNLYRHKSGTYYLRISTGSKLSWRSLGTKVKQVALAEMVEAQKEAERLAEIERSPDQLPSNVSVGEVIDFRLRQIDDDPSLKPTTRHYWHQVYEGLRRSWKGLNERTIKSIRPSECEKWARDYSRTISATRYNNTLAGLRKLFDLAVKQGVRRTNPAEHIKRLPPSSKDLSLRLPSRKQFHEWVEAIRHGGGRFSQDSGDFVEFLAYSGMRVGEAKHVLWKHCDFQRGEIVVEGDPETGTKNRSSRRVPMIAPMQQLLKRIRGKREVTPGDPVCLVNEAQKSMDRAAEEISMARITHHDLRHLFATTCIESGVDIPTVASWLGHKDGGALAMKVYGHLRNEHSLAAARKVSFDG